MENDLIVFHGNLQQLLEKGGNGRDDPETTGFARPDVQIFYRVRYVISGTGTLSPSCTVLRGGPLYMSDFVRTRECCEIRGVPLEPTACTTLDESNVIYGGEGKLLEAVKEADTGGTTPTSSSSFPAAAPGLSATMSRVSPARQRNWSAAGCWPLKAKVLASRFPERIRGCVQVGVSMELMDPPETTC